MARYEGEQTSSPDNVKPPQKQPRNWEKRLREEGMPANLSGIGHRRQCPHAWSPWQEADSPDSIRRRECRKCHKIETKKRIPPR